MTRARPEARLETDILLAVGADPRVSVYKNEVGRGFRGSLLRALTTALPQHTTVILATCNSYRVQYGLGVGSPDLVAIGLGGAFVGLELKAPDGGRVSQDQQTWHEAARARGARVVVVRSVDEAREALGI